MSETARRLDGLRLGSGISPSRREEILDLFEPLETQLARLPADGFDAELSVKDGDEDREHNKKMQTTLEVWSSGGHRYVTTSREPDLERALVEVRDDMRRTIHRTLDRTIDRKRRAADRRP